MSQTAPEAASQTSTWNIDPVHSTAEFKVKHMMISNVRGHFSRLSGVLTLDESDVTKSKVEASIEAASIDTRDDQRDTHLRSADFLDVEILRAVSIARPDDALAVPRPDGPVVAARS